MIKQKLLFTFALLLTAVTGAWADGSWTSGGCDVTLVGGTLTVSKSSSGDGAMGNYTSSSNQPWKNSRNDITSVVIGDGVTSIGNYAFRDCGYLTSVTIGSNVGSIGNYAFDACLRLASVSIPASVTSIGISAFVSCGRSAAALVVTIADGSLLSSIGMQAFWYANLASFNIPASVTSIGKWAFRYCYNLSSVIIQAPSLTTYGEDPFADNKDGRMIYVPINSVNTYKTYWANYENYITGHPLTAHAAVAATCTTAGNTAYWECEICHKYFSDENGGPEIAANGWVIPATGHTIVNNICTGCGKYGTCGTSGHESDVTWELTGESSNYTLTISGTGATPGYDVENVPWYNERNNITSVVIGDGVTAIGKYAFYDCSNLASLTIGSSLQSIGIWAFSGCSKLASVNLPATMTSIGDNAFDNCSNLSSVVIHATSVPTCLSDAFKANKAGRKIFVPAASVESYGSGWSAYAADIIGYNGTCGATGHESDVVYALTGESPNRTLYISGTGAMKDMKDNDKPWSDFTTVIIGDGVTHIGKQSFDYLSFTSLTIGNGVKSIGELAFHNCSGLTSIVIPNSVETIGNKAFEFITTLTSLTIGSGVTSMADDAFDYCENVTSLTISDGVTTIGKGAFKKYSSLTSVVIPSSVTSVGDSSFSECNNLTSVTLNSNPQIQPNAFPGTATVTMNLTANPVGDDKWMTFFNGGYHFKAGENTTVYKGTLSGSSIVLKPVEDKIVTAGTAVILKSTGNPVMTLNSAASSDTNSNSLQGVSDLAGKTAANPSTTYVLNYKEGTGVGFYKLKSGKTLGYGKAYLDTSTTGAPSYLNFEENETTEVREVKEVNVVIEVNDNSWYTLDGRKMDSKPTAKGLYIVNGKKVVIK